MLGLRVMLAERTAQYARGGRELRHHHKQCKLEDASTWALALYLRILRLERRT